MLAPLYIQTGMLGAAERTRQHTTDALKHLTSTRSHTTNSYLIQPATYTRTHATDSFLSQYAARYKTHSTDAYLSGGLFTAPAITTIRAIDRISATMACADRTQGAVAGKKRVVITIDAEMI